MIRNQTWMQAYKKAPWRKQLQLIGAYSAALVLISIIAGTYLNVTSRAATIGRQVQKIQENIRSVKQDIVNHETHLAQITSARIMAQRAKDLGYHTIMPETSIYLLVEGYSGKPTAQLAPSAQKQFPIQPQLPIEHTESLIEWIREQIYLIGLQTGAQEAQP